jgi:uncharacterized membrane protein YuzA (DUF378 family)
MNKSVFIVLMILIILGSLNWLAVGLGVNVLEKVFGSASIVPRILYVIIGLAALAIAFDRDTYLPFLGPSVVPCALIPESIPKGADTTVEVVVAPGAKVLYWAAEPGTEGMKKINDWRGAYLEFMNAGATKADSDGTAALLVRNPQPYSVPWKGRIEPHIHFRVCGENGMMGRIQTVYMADGRVEGFVDED